MNESKVMRILQEHAFSFKDADEFIQAMKENNETLTKSDLASVRTEIANVRTDLVHQKVELIDRLDKAKTSLGTYIALATGFLTLIMALFRFYKG